MEKITLKEKLQYRFDQLMSKGTIALVGMLFSATAAVIIVTGLLTVLVSPDVGSVGESIWASVMYVIDAGTITGAATDNIPFLILMSIVTLCGIFVTSILIGIITTGFEEKLNTLKRGNSHVIEENHTVILGFDSNVYTLISEIIGANENQKDGCIVVLAEEDKEEVEAAIATEISDFKNTRVLVRTGSIADAYMLGRCSLENSRAIIINEQEDFMTVKAVLAVTAYLKKYDGGVHKPHIVATVNEQSNYEATQVISDGNTDIILVQDAISRIIAQTCRQSGLSNVLMELFNYDGDELYFEHFPQLTGKTFGDALSLFQKAVVFGYKRGENVFLNPPKDIVLEQQDLMLLLVEDDNVAKVKQVEVADIATIRSTTTYENEPENILILGENAMLEQIVVELDEYFTKGSHILLAVPQISDAIKAVPDQLNNITMSFVECDANHRETLRELTSDNITHVLILSDNRCDVQTSDAMTLLKLIHLRDIAKKENRHYNITSEMKDVANQKLAMVAEVNDLVIGSNIINLILTQISESRDLAVVFQDLLNSDGSEIYIRKASHYVQLHTPMNFYQVTAVLCDRNEIAIGYKKQTGNTFEIITNPDKSEMIMFAEDDYIIALAES